MHTTQHDTLHADDGLQVAYGADLPEVAYPSTLEVVDPGKHQQDHEWNNTDATSFHELDLRRQQPQRKCGLRKNAFWIIIMLVLLLVVAGAVGGGVEGSKAIKKSTQRYLHKGKNAAKTLLRTV